MQKIITRLEELRDRINDNDMRPDKDVRVVDDAIARIKACRLIIRSARAKLNKGVVDAHRNRDEFEKMFTALEEMDK